MYEFHWYNGVYCHGSTFAAKKVDSALFKHELGCGAALVQLLYVTLRSCKGNMSVAC